MKKIVKIFVISLVIVFSAGCSLKKTQTTTPAATPSNDFLSQDSVQVLAKEKANFQKAKTAATAWKSDASFTALNFKVPADLKPASLSETFIFGSASDPDNWWTYSIDSSGKFVRAIIPKDDFLGKKLLPLDEKFWKISYVDALNAADAAGGNTFKAENPEAEEIVTLEQGEPKNWLWYLIEYRGATTSKKIHVNANDGKVYDDKGNPTTSSQTKTP